MATKKQIVMVGPSTNSQGGIASVVATWKQAGIFERWPITYLETHVEGTSLAKLRVGCVALVRLAILLISNRVACIHLHVARHTSFWRKSIFALAGFLMRRPVLLHFHSGGFSAFYHNDCNYLQKQAVRFILNHADQLITLSQSWREILRPISTNHRISVVENFLVPPLEIPDDATRSKYQILFLGLLNRDKGFFDLLEAVGPLCAEFPSLVLVCGGKGNQAEVNERIQKLCIENHVKLLGWISGSPKNTWLSGACFYVLPSYVEGIPMGVLEAMAWGMPVVASKIGGIPDIIEDGREGLLIKPGNIVGLRNAMRQLLQDDDKRRRMGLAARNKIERAFSAEAIMPKVDLLYEEYCEIRIASSSTLGFQREKSR
jgi:glycosyltransferase involved in cell wall biosynthesis